MARAPGLTKRSSTVSGVCEDLEALAGRTPSGGAACTSGLRIQANHPVMMPAKDSAEYCMRAVGEA